MMIWYAKHPKFTVEMLGFLPQMLNEHDPKPAREQLGANYQHGGGWQPFQGFTLTPEDTLEYPGDPPMQLLAETMLREERILFFQHSWVAIVQPDGSYEVCRMD